MAHILAVRYFLPYKYYDPLVNIKCVYITVATSKDALFNNAQQGFQMCFIEIMHDTGLSITILIKGF